MQTTLEKEVRPIFFIRTISDEDAQTVEKYYRLRDRYVLFYDRIILSIFGSTNERIRENVVICCTRDTWDQLIQWKFEFSNEVIVELMLQLIGKYSKLFIGQGSGRKSQNIIKRKIDQMLINLAKEINRPDANV